MDFSHYKCFLFDADGTLFDTAELIFQCFRYSLKRFGGVSVEREQVYSTIGLPLRDQFERYLGPLEDGDASEMQKAHMEFQLSIYKEYLSLFSGIKETLRVLKGRGKSLGVVTSRRAYSLNLFLETLDIQKFFSTIVTPEDTERHKPLPDPVVKGAANLGEDVRDCIYIGDALYDIQAGRAAGMDTGFVSWSFTDPKRFDEKDLPDVIIQRPEDLAG